MPPRAKSSALRGGIVVSYAAPDEHDSIRWYCPVCHDNGSIRGWQNALWDRFPPGGIV